MLKKIYKLLCMDICNLLFILIILSPLVFGLYLLFSRITYSLVNKKILNYGLCSVNSLNLIFGCVLMYFTLGENFSFKYSVDFYNFSLGLILNKENILFLFGVCLFYFLINLFIVYFLNIKKHFLFTKQRYYIILSFLITNTLLFVCSLNLLQSLVLCVVQSMLLFLFLYFDIFKETANYNMTRFFRINFVGDFCLLAAFILFYKYALLSQSYINSSCIEYDKLNLFFSYMMGISSPVEYKFAIVFVLVFVFGRLVIFPFNCVYSFLANSSSAVYLPTAICVNNIFGTFVYLKLLPACTYFQNLNFVILIFAGITAITSCLCILFEKNLKIIFGYILAILNSLFLYFAISFKQTSIVYFACLLILLLILIKLFSCDKINFSRRIINKNKGFYLERLQIFIFEKVLLSLADFILLFNRYICRIIFAIFKSFSNFVSNIFVIKTLKSTKITIIKNIFLIFALLIIFVIMLILFEGVDFG